jgi:phage shock protein A
MLGRIVRYFKSLFSSKMDQLEDPEVLLAQAQEDMKQNLVQNRERAVEAITQKNRLKLMVEEGEKKASQLQAQAEQALKRGDRDLALKVMHEKLIHDKALGETWQAYEQAMQTSDSIKTAIRREEEQYRQRLAEKLALVANWKQSQIQISINKALEGMSVEEASAGWERAQEKILMAQSEAQARTELASASVQAKFSELEDRGMDIEAERQLAELESRMLAEPEQAPQLAASNEPVDETAGEPEPEETVEEASEGEEKPSEEQKPE